MQQALDGTRALVDAAKRLLAALSPDCVASSAVDGRIEQFLSRHPIPANWTSARSLSVRVLELVRWLQGAPETQDDASMPRASADAVRELLKGPLDWLDTPWLYAQLIGERTEPSSERARTATYRGHLLTPSQDRLLEHLSADLRARKLRLPDGADEDELIVRLIGWAAAEASGSEPLDRSIVTVIEEIVCALLAIEREARDGLVEKRTTSVARDTRGAPGSPTPRRVAALRAAGPSAAELLQAAIDMRGRLDERGVPAPAAGIFLLARAVIDLRLPALANRFGVPLAPMLAALGAKWLGAPLPADAPTALWAGAESWELAGLDKTGDALRALNESLFELLVDRGALQGATARKVIAADAGTLDCRLECSLETDGSVSETACLLLRQWARWLPGVGDASPLFLLRRCVRRAGLVEASDEEIFVHLEPAPLDVVLEMAGYLATIERVAWLGDRSVRFSLLRLADA